MKGNEEMGDGVPTYRAEGGTDGANFAVRAAETKVRTATKVVLTFAIAKQFDCKITVWI